MDNIFLLILNYLNSHNIGDVLIRILEFLAAVGIFQFIYKKVRFRIRIWPVNLAYKVFSDRTNYIAKICGLLNGDTQIINLYGSRGVGKSAVLAFIANLINNLSSKSNKEYTKKIRKENKKFIKSKKAIYLEISADQNSKEIMENLSIKLTGTSNYNARELVTILCRRYFYLKHIIIIFDNVSNQALEHEIEKVIQSFWEFPSKFLFIVGSVDELLFLNLKNIKKRAIELKVFAESDIYEYIQKNANTDKISTEYLKKILNLSEGLPVFVDFLLPSNLEEEVFLFSNKNLQKYISQILDSLPNETLELARYIALISIFQVEIPFVDLKKISFCKLSHQINILENHSVLNFDNSSKKIRMHELFRDMINTEYMDKLQDKLHKISVILNLENHPQKIVYYLILLEQISTDENMYIQQTIINAIEEENYSFLIFLGEHFKRFNEFLYQTSSLEKDTFLSIILGYLEGLIGIGNYVAAKGIVDICHISIRNSETDISFRLSLLIANLYHLQNEYDLAINSYQILLECTNTVFCNYKALCYYGIAHSYRHQGLYFDLAIENYRLAIHYAKKHEQQGLMIKCKHELMTIYIFLDKPTIAGTFIKNMDAYIKKLPPNTEKLAVISYRKSKARYMRFYCPKTTEKQYGLLIQIRHEYETIKKRLQYNSYFELGEFFRIQKEYNKAFEQYSIAYKFSLKNHDVNLETMCFFGILLSELESHTLLLHSSKFEQEDNLLNIICKCKEKDLCYNTLIGEIINSKLKNTVIDSSILIKMKNIGYMHIYEVAKGIRPLNRLYLILT